MKIFSDFHHSGLGYSLHLLFERRFKAELYFPIGTEWFEQDYWYIAKPYDDSRDTINQYLQLDNRYEPKDGTLPLNDIFDSSTTHYEIYDHAHQYSRKAITLEQFKNMEIDIIIASIPEHWRVYKRLRDIYKPKAKVICQMGNMFVEIEDYIREGYVKNLMASTVKFNTPTWINTLFYHQEINQNVFEYTPPDNTNMIASFVNLGPRKDLFNTYSSALPDFKWRQYGASTRDGNVDTIYEIAAKMKRSTWGWHIKPGGDGFGHIWFNWGFIGRPIITNFSDYKDKLGAEIFEDGVTGIDLELHSADENIERIKKLSQPENHLRMCEEISARTRARINYKQEEELVQRFMENLI